MDLRMQFITEYLTEAATVSELAAAYSISRKTAYYWIRLYHRDGPGRLAGASRRPHTSPRQTPAEIVEQLLAARRRRPTWGAGKLRDWLVRRAPTTAWPCRDTIHTILRRTGAVRRRRTRHPGPPPSELTRPTRPNLVWTVDFKGHFRTGDGTRCYPFTLRDGFSRFVLRCAAVPHPTLAATQAQCARAFAEYGLPDCLRSDNGAPFAGPGLAGLSRLAVWWLRLGIQPQRIAPGQPQQNGSHEQFHAVLKRETAHPPAASRAAQQRRFTAFVADYNYERPHDAVAHAPPATRYTPSPRPFPRQLPPLEYPLDWDVRRVSGAGQVKWQGRPLFLSGVLAGEDVAFEPVDDGQWLLRYATMPLALFDERRHVLVTGHARAASAGPPVIEGPAPAAPAAQ